ncbi:hypothetical protein CALVIDRAFT_538728 [Calocera viscosa TUFC12733]|uniref:Uncharacterized protein n=1 Tax=Calocera viscosa (strain TUFC12733) TaxID=1330018 RepID=A0A167KFY7_CALVF|nr:hypothetical protein CALVIDRAFT_538728 [Calocera viscosa TUFC12733]
MAPDDQLDRETASDSDAEAERTTTDVLSLYRKSAPALPVGVKALGGLPTPMPYRLTPSGSLAIRSDEAALPSASENARFLFRLQAAPRCTLNFTLSFPGNGPLYDVGPVFEGGVSVYLDHARHFDFAVTRNLVWTGQARVRTVGPEPVVSGQYAIDLPAKLRIETYEDRYEFWSVHKREPFLVETLENTVLGGEFKGVVIGPYLMSLEPVEMYVEEWLVHELHDDDSSEE